MQGCVLRPLCQTSTEPIAIGGDHREVFPQVNLGIVGLAGLEPAASSLSEIDGQAPCYPAIALVVRLRKSYKDGVNREPAVQSIMVVGPEGAQFLLVSVLFRSSCPSSGLGSVGRPSAVPASAGVSGGWSSLGAPQPGW
jgi:hypothetical protein